MRKGITIVGAALAFALAPLPSRAVERIYSARIFPPLQRAMTGLSNYFSIALLDWLLLLVIALVLFLAIQDARRSTAGRAAIRTLWRVVVVAAAGYLAFLAAWGFNYRRVPLPQRVAFDAEQVTPGAAARLAATTVARLNALHAPAHAAGWPAAGAIDPALAAAFNRALEDLGGGAITLGRPKRSMLDWYLRRTGVSGMTDPLFLEIFVASDLLPFERPFVIAHEWSHLAGITNEGEANLAGWLACVRGSPPAQYSGWLFMYSEALGALPSRDRAALASQLGAGAREDLRAVRDRLAREINPRLSAAGWRVYDSYLKANRVEAGAASYDEVVRLALGLRAAHVY
jgi:hypothetical protein